MKKRFLKYMRNEITNKNKHYSKDKIDEIMYGIEGIYLTFTKSLIIFGVAILLNLFKEIIILLITYNFIRLFAFGMHASKSWHCLIFSLITFVMGSYLCKTIIIPKIILILLYSISFVILLVYAPADTHKRPLINSKKRNRYKLLSMLVLLAYFIVSLVVKKNLIINCLTIGVLIECILVLPLTYKVFNLPYCNYKKYGLNTN